MSFACRGALLTFPARMAGLDAFAPIVIIESVLAFGAAKLPAFAIVIWDYHRSRVHVVLVPLSTQF